MFGKMKKILSFLFFTLLFFSLSAETETCSGGYCFDCYGTSQGLPQNQVVEFGLSGSGFMFIAGRNSFSRFDGRNFVLPLENIRSSLLSTTFNGFAPASGGAFLATDAGLWFFNSDRFDAGTVENIGAVGRNSVRSIAFDKESGRLFGAVGGIGVFEFSANSVDWFNPENSRLETRNVNKVFADRAGNIWLGTTDSVYFLKKGEQKFRRIEYLEDSVSAFADFDGSSVAAGGKNGLYIITGNGEVDKTFASGEIRITEITALKNASDGRLWIGTKNSGIALFDGGSFEKITPPAPDSLKTITALAEDGEGQMWIGTHSGGFCIARQSALRDFILKNETVENAVSDTLGNIWINTLNSGIIRLSGYGENEAVLENSRGFSDIFIDSQNNLWASSGETGLYILQNDSVFKPVKELFESEDDLFPASADLFFEDSDGNIWTNDTKNLSALFAFMSDRTVEKLVLPLQNAEIAAILQHNGRFYIATKSGDVFEKKQDGTIQPVTPWNRSSFVKKIFADSKQRIWVVTAADKIFIGVEKDIIPFPLRGDLSSGVIHSITEDRHGDFWITTNSGVLRFSGETVDCLINGSCSSVPVSIYGKSRGLPFPECAEGRKSMPALSESGLLFVPMISGVAVFDTDYKEKNNSVPEVGIEKIVAETKEKHDYYSPDLSGKFILPHHARKISVFYSAAFFTNPEALLFEYSFDKSAFTGTSSGFAGLENLDSGTAHTFTVRAYLADDTENFTEKTFSFEIPAEFYQKTAFKLTLPLAFIFLLFVFVFMNRRLKIMHETEIRRRIDEKTAELQMKNNTLKEAVMKDPLTGLMNRRFLFDVEERKIRRFIDSRDRKNHLLDNRISEKSDLVYGVIMMDIDHFKRVNDIYGHDVGDSVLKGIAEIMQDSVRVDDILIRWGGEEFLIVLKNIPVSKIIEVAKKIRKAIETHPFEIKEGSNVWITASLGVVFLPFFASDPKLLAFENIVTLADLALYNSKKNGRDMATFVVPGKNTPKTDDEIQGMLGSSEFAAVNDFYSFEKIEPDNFSEFEI